MATCESSGTSRVAVVGAGIVGASVAFRLAEGGARVWIFDRAQPAGGTTSASFAWVNANEKTPYDYFELNYAGLKEHYRLRDELPGGAPWLYTGGNLDWTDDGAALQELRRRVERLRSWCYAVEWREASRVNELLEPNVAFPSPDTPVAFFPEETWVDAPRLTNVLVELARRSGAETGFGVAVEGIEVKNGRVAAIRLSDGDRLPVEVVVNAAGPEADRVAAMADLPLPLATRRGLLGRLAVKDHPLRRILHSPQVNLRPDGPGHVLAHHGSMDERLEREGTETINSLCSELLERARKVVPALEGAEISEARVGVRPLPEDGRSCVGAVPAVPGYYEAVTHSGVTLGPLVGRLLAKEILTGEIDSLIAPFCPDRFVRR